MDESIRHPLVYARSLRGWSQTDLAVRMGRSARGHGLRSGADKSLISKWERWRKVPNQESQLLLAEAFGVDPGLLSVLDWPHWLPGRDDPISFSPTSSVAALREALKLSVDRRSFLAYTGASLTGIALEWATVAPSSVIGTPHGHRVDAELVRMLEEHSATLTKLATEQRQHVAPLLDAHLTAVTDLISTGRYTPAMGRRLHTLAAGLSQTVGWYHFDHGQHASAARFWHGALHSAHRSADRDLGAGILSDLAYQATWLHDPATAVQILEHAITGATHPAARSVLQLRKARAHAALGEERVCNRALAAAEKELASASHEPSPSWCTWMSDSDLAVDSGRCQIDLGYPRKGHQLVQEGTRLLPHARMKTRSVFLAYEADAFLRSGDVEQAAAAASQALTVAHRIGAPRCVALVHDLVPAFSAHPSAEGVPELLQLTRPGGGR
ncbi:multiprotein-bridging factor 1 family protein [Streptomyces sp. NPDC052396]|uniref:multiprotein-bridging factor 1 family protein n=1 Tax=Streptomyces sp. NPDC052396 TaxID=3365689 RepID=UPI0037CE9E72